MTAKDFLLRARRLQARINQLEKARQSVWAAATATTTAPGQDPIRSGGVSRKPEQYGEFISELDAEYRRLDEIKADTLRVIGQVQDNTLAALLMAYYVNGLTWEQTAVEIGYSYFRTVHDKHAQALAAVEKILPT